MVEIDSYEFIGSGSVLAEDVAEKVRAAGLSTARTIHLVAQVNRELKGNGQAVGGNTEIYARRLAKNAEPFFQQCPRAAALPPHA